MNTYQTVIEYLKTKPKRWLVTGATGFIGSHLVNALNSLGQTVIGLDDFSFSSKENIKYVQNILGENLIIADITKATDITPAFKDIDFVLHHAAIGSVPLSYQDTVKSEHVNNIGFLNVLKTAAENKVKKFVYASSCAVYGDSGNQTNRENNNVKPQSPYAAMKYANELYAKTLSEPLDIQTIGLRYFNIFGKRQDPEGAYAAVIPKWIQAMLENKPVSIFGNGQQSRDFCSIHDVVQSNILAATTKKQNTVNQVYNIASGQSISLNNLFDLIKKHTGYNNAPVYFPSRTGDIQHSSACIDNVANALGYSPQTNLDTELPNIIQAYREKL